MESSTQLVHVYTHSPPTYTLSVSLISQLTESFPSFMNDTSTDTTLIPVVASADQSLPCRNSLRNRHSPARYCTSATMHSSEFSAFVSAINSLQKSKSYFEAVKSPKWQYAMNEELTTFQHTRTWDLVPMPPSANLISCK